MKVVKCIDQLLGEMILAPDSRSFSCEEEVSRLNLYEEMAEAFVSCEVCGVRGEPSKSFKTSGALKISKLKKQIMQMCPEVEGWPDVVLLHRGRQGITRSHPRRRKNT